MSETFDTLAAAQTLRNKGMDSDHAEAIVEVVRNAQSELATKADIKALENRFDRVDDRFDSLGENLRTEMKGLDDRIDSLAESLRTEMKALGGRIDTLGERIGTIQWAGALVAGVLTAAVMTTLGIVVMQTFQS